MTSHYTNYTESTDVVETYMVGDLDQSKGATWHALISQVSQRHKIC